MKCKVCKEKGLDVDMEELPDKRGHMCRECFTVVWRKDIQQIFDELDRA